MRSRDDDANRGCILVLDDAPPLCVSIDIISLSDVEDAPIVSPSDNGQVDIAFFFISCLGLEVKSMSE